MGIRPRVGVLVLVLLATAACQLQEITVVDLVKVVVAEVYVTIGDAPSDNRVRAFLHGTEPGAPAGTATFDDATVRVSRADGLSLDLSVGVVDDCVTSQPDNGTGTCFVADSADEAQLRAGDALALSIVLGDGGTIDGATTVPGDFHLDGIAPVCRLLPDTTMTVRWSRSDGAWAYVNETLINGLSAALAPEGIQVDDPLYLLGLSISSSDTTVVFPSEFGIFNRFDLDQALSVRLQRGLPDSTSARVSIAAVDRNYVNWARGGTFNPSGEVRVSSLRGAGSGVFGSAVVRRFDAVSSSDPSAGPTDCPLF
jgi:hypothetical protein